jgi:uncharacterized protein (DUF488 family)
MIFTIGHSTHPLDKFIRLLERHDITAICDVRSSPYSQFNPQFNQQELKAGLQERGIKYVFLGEELGARSDDPSCYRDGKVQYDLLAKTELFKRGLERVCKGSEEYRIALMCAEKDPLECHRTILVSRELNKEGLAVEHILADGDVETHENATNRLVKSLKLDHRDLFRTEAEVRDQAYKIQGDSIAYSLDEVSKKTHRRQRAVQ